MRFTKQQSPPDLSHHAMHRVMRDDMPLLKRPKRTKTLTIELSRLLPAISPSVPPTPPTPNNKCYNGTRGRCSAARAGFNMRGEAIGAREARPLPGGEAGVPSRLTSPPFSTDPLLLGASFVKDVRVRPVSGLGRSWGAGAVLTPKLAPAPSPAFASSPSTASSSAAHGGTPTEALLLLMLGATSAATLVVAAAASRSLLLRLVYSNAKSYST